ncbi:MAG: RsbRD N-terminal domain-containing protein [Nitrospirae bacterium]|nr:RsbRD N-terminal domain-containing protein [Nitrospirota bacterium]
MKLNELLYKKREDILKKWFELIIETYPPETALFLRNKKDRFSNPVGSIIYDGAKNLLDEILQGINPENVPVFLDNIIRVRAVQDFLPSQAISFIFILKDVVRKELLNKIRHNGLAEELLEFESQIDNLAKLSFDIFMQCRERIYEIKAMELNKQTYTLLKRAKLIIDLEDKNDDAETTSA